jgi:hypothetical protein
VLVILVTARQMEALREHRAHEEGTPQKVLGGLAWHTSGTILARSGHTLFGQRSMLALARRQPIVVVS